MRKRPTYGARVEGRSQVSWSCPRSVSGQGCRRARKTESRRRSKRRSRQRKNFHQHLISRAPWQASACLLSRRIERLQNLWLVQSDDIAKAGTLNRVNLAIICSMHRVEPHPRISMVCTCQRCAPDDEEAGEDESNIPQGKKGDGDFNPNADGDSEENKILGDGGREINNWWRTWVSRSSRHGAPYSMDWWFAR